MQSLDLAGFKRIVDEYCSHFKNLPANTQQLVRFCQEQHLGFKYGELNPLFQAWLKQKQETNTSAAGSPADESLADWDAFWKEYEAKYQYSPKKAVHLWNFAKEEKMLNVKFKGARQAFQRISRTKGPSSASEGGQESSNDNGIGLGTTSMSGAKTELQLKIDRSTPENEVQEIKQKFLECLERFRHDNLHDPTSSRQLFNFINKSTQYKVRYGGVQNCYRLAVQEQWFLPMKRVKRGQLVDSDEEEGAGSDEGQEGAKFVLEIDQEKINAMKEEKEDEKENFAMEEMTDAQFDALLSNYHAQYENPPRNARQIMHFARDIGGENYKFKACRVAFQRWSVLRGRAMPNQQEK